MDVDAALPLSWSYRLILGRHQAVFPFVVARATPQATGNVFALKATRGFVHCCPFAER